MKHSELQRNQRVVAREDGRWLPASVVRADAQAVIVHIDGHQCATPYPPDTADVKPLTTRQFYEDNMVIGHDQTHSEGVE